MEQMKFEQGDLQQEAPKRIKKRQPPRRRLRALAVVAAAMQAEKDESGCARLFQYSSDGSSRYADLNGSLLVASANEITLLDDKGNAVYHTALQFSQVALSAADGQAAVYEIGGRTLYLLNSRGLVQQMDLEGDIFAVQMGQGGRFAVTLKKTGYKTTVSVYNGKGEPLYDFNSAQSYLLTAAVSENGKYMAAAAMSQDNGSFVSSLQIYKLTSETMAAEGTLEGGVYEMGTVGGRFCAATDKALYFVKTDGTVTSYDFQGASLSRCGLGADKFAAVLLENYASGGQTHLAIVNAAGEEISSMAVDSEVLDLSAAGRYLAVLYSNKLVIYDQKLRECAVLEDVSSARRVLMTLGGVAAMIVSFAGAGIAAGAFSGTVAKWIRPVLEKKLESKGITGGSTAEMVEQAGFFGDTARRITDSVGTLVKETKETMVAAVTDGIAQSIAYALVYLAAFVILMLLCRLLLRMLKLAGRLPGLRTLNLMGGGALGLAVAVLLVFLAVWVLQRLQLVITEDMVQQSALLQFFVGQSPMDWFTSL